MNAGRNGASRAINPCTRCGKERIVAREWQEKVIIYGGSTVITRTETVCPDPECQKIVEKKLKSERGRFLRQQADKLLRIAEAKAKRVLASVSK